MRVHHRRRALEPGGILERRAHKKGEAQRIVRIIDVVDAVKRIAVEQVAAVDQERARAAAESRLEKGGVAHQTADGDRKPVGGSTGRHAAVPRQNHRDVPPSAGNRRRQRAEHVGQATGL